MSPKLQKIFYQISMLTRDGSGRTSNEFYYNMFFFIQKCIFEVSK